MTKILFVCYHHGCRGERLSVNISQHKDFRTLDAHKVGGRTIIKNDYFDKKFLNSWSPEFDKLKNLRRSDFLALDEELQRGDYAIYLHFHGFLLPIILGKIYGSMNNQWEDDLLKYVIEEKVESISDVDWDHVLKQKPFLTKKQASVMLNSARNKAKIEGPLYEQIAAFRTRVGAKRSPASSIAQRKVDINKLYDAMINAKSQ